MASIPAVSTDGGGSGMQSFDSLGQSVIPVVNKLQDIFVQLGSASTIDLPQVAVVGSQSSGKSSVLEALVGRDFLPRGVDICTRRPLVLQLVQLPRRSNDQSETEWGEFLHLPGRRFTDFGMIRDEIQTETERQLGNNKGISDKQIRLKIFSPNVLNITLVDLPGITKVPVGDQPSDIEARLRTMILSYIKHETCVILAVSPANADLANSDALQMARMVDPDGSRTIGVITKLDIMDRGTDARSLLLGNTIPLRLGYVGVVNRSQEDILANKSIRDALVYEENFFRSRPIYHSLADRCGVSQLAKKLNTILVQHIKSILPDLKARINAQLVAISKELNSYGKVTDSKSGQGVLMLNILTNYSKSFSSAIEGRDEDMSTSELSGGARLHFIFQNIFVKTLDEIDPRDDLSDEDIRIAIQNSSGSRSMIFIPEIPFQVLVRRQIARLLDPSLQCARFIYDELVTISHRCETNELLRFPNLRRSIEEVMAVFLREGLSPAETIICHLLEMEMDYINTSHPSFIGGSKALETALQQHRVARASALPSKSMDSSDWKDSSADKLTDRVSKARGILARTSASVVGTDLGMKSANASANKMVTSGNSWGISSIFSAANGKDHPVSKPHNETVQSMDSSFAMIQLKEPPTVLRTSDAVSENETVEITVTKLLIKSYYDIVRKNVQDAVPKAIMHFLVNHAKRELLSVFIRKLYRENLFEELLKENDDIAVKRKRCSEMFSVLQQAGRTLEDLPLEMEAPSSGDVTGLPPSIARTQGLHSLYSREESMAGVQSQSASFMGSPMTSRRPLMPGEQLSFANDSNGGYPDMMIT